MGALEEALSDLFFFWLGIIELLIVSDVMPPENCTSGRILYLGILPMPCDGLFDYFTHQIAPGARILFDGRCVNRGRSIWVCACCDVAVPLGCVEEILGDCTEISKQPLERNVYRSSDCRTLLIAINHNTWEDGRQEFLKDSNHVPEFANLLHAVQLVSQPDNPQSYSSSPSS